MLLVFIVYPAYQNNFQELSQRMLSKKCSRGGCNDINSR